MHTWYQVCIIIIHIYAYYIYIYYVQQQRSVCNSNSKGTYTFITPCPSWPAITDCFYIYSRPSLEVPPSLLLSILFVRANTPSRTNL